MVKLIWVTFGPLLGGCSMPGGGLVLLPGFQLHLMATWKSLVWFWESVGAGGASHRKSGRRTIQVHSDHLTRLMVSAGNWWGAGGESG